MISKKFTGQEDNGELKQPQEKDEEHVLTFFLKPQSHSKWVISTTKENGETGHLAVLKRSDGEFVYVVGSKNTHLVVQTLEDIERTRELGKQVNGGDVFFAATSISIPILRMIMTLEAPKRTLLCEFLWQTRATASFEVLCLSHQHVQLLDYLTQDTPVFYGLSLMSFNSPDDAEMCVNPVLLYEFMRALGVRTVAYDIAQFTPENVENVLERSKRAYKHEGSVHLFLDDRAAVIGMQKSKSIWYVCLRAIREKAKSFCRTLYSTKVSKDRTTPLSPIEKLDTAKKAIHARFKTIPPFLKISDEVANVYETLGKQFIEYLFEFELFCGLAASGDQKEQCKQVTKDVTNLFPMMWRKFLDHTGQTDDFSLQSS
ncbi:hypothetical protein PsorP6_017793 [Peronosclerospora sorghi]|uniref:Uncharacterized protein n=1 Tax=Peronosclerospora sorghi TaxID=230839 RepID=A0ACC0WLF7_9STRA|nr:hypothetical protein PsorP6_017793 [Peronosclerospora sorghi]